MPLFCLKPSSILLLHFAHLSNFTSGHSLPFSLGCSHTGLLRHILEALTCNFLCSWVFAYLAPSHNLGLSKNITSLDRCFLDYFFPTLSPIVLLYHLALFVSCIVHVMIVLCWFFICFLLYTLSLPIS